MSESTERGSTQVSTTALSGPPTNDETGEIIAVEHDNLRDAIEIDLCDDEPDEFIDVEFDQRITRCEKCNQIIRK